MKLRRSAGAADVGPIVIPSRCNQGRIAGSLRRRPGKPLQWGPVADRPTMTKRIGKTSLTVRPPRRVVGTDRFHVGGASSRSPFDEFIGFIDEHLDPGGRQSCRCRARLPILAGHGFVDEERGATQVQPSNAAKVPQPAGTNAVVYHVTAASLSDTINITDRTGRTAALLIVIEDGTGDRRPRVRTWPELSQRLRSQRNVREIAHVSPMCGVGIPVACG